VAVTITGADKHDLAPGVLVAVPLAPEMAEPEVRGDGPSATAIGNIVPGHCGGEPRALQIVLFQATIAR